MNEHPPKPGAVLRAVAAEPAAVAKQRAGACAELDDATFPGGLNTGGGCNGALGAFGLILCVGTGGGGGGGNSTPVCFGGSTFTLCVVILGVSSLTLSNSLSSTDRLRRTGDFATGIICSGRSGRPSLVT